MKVRFKRATLVLAYAHERFVEWRIYQEGERAPVSLPPTKSTDGNYIINLRGDPAATHLTMVPPGSFRVIESDKP
jgi:hypothetical protein